MKCRKRKEEMLHCLLLYFLEKLILFPTNEVRCGILESVDSLSSC